MQLGYDLTPFLNSCIGGPFPTSTVAQLQNSHNINPFLPGHLTFSTLLSGFYYGFELPIVRFIFRDPDCSDGAEYSYNYDDGYLCQQNKIKDAPRIMKSACWVDFFAKTVTTTDEVCFKWYASLPLIFGPTGTADAMDVVSYADLYYPIGFVSSGTKSEDNEVAVRVEDGHTFLVDNTVTRVIHKGEYGLKRVSREVFYSDVLKQNVCVGGKVKPNYKWAAPEIVELIDK